MSKGKILIGVAVVFSVAVLLWAASYESEPEPEPEPTTMAEAKIQQMNRAADAGTLEIRLDASDVEDVIDYMGRGADEMTRSPSGYRRFHYEMNDGSSVLFFFDEAHGGGLKLHHYRAER